jgi:hypothetical protein
VKDVTAGHHCCGPQALLVVVVVRVDLVVLGLFCCSAYLPTYLTCWKNSRQAHTWSGLHDVPVNCLRLHRQMAPLCIQLNVRLSYLCAPPAYSCSWWPCLMWEV